ncbi:MAG: D-alanine--D-alanine ligase [Chitinophagaceae bacterium]|nr:D-alanine--D-alanine ligase [Chitinophagaceae bacterium]
MNVVQRILHRRFFIKLFNWEYGSVGAVYTWLYPFWILLCIRSRSFFFFAASNPTIENGGFLNETKKAITPLIPAQYHPKTVFFSLPANAEIVLKELNKHGLSFPLIGKPDIGGRGRGVKALKDDTDVRSYVAGTVMDFHIQEYVAFKKEVGVFYYRMPGEATGKVTGIVRKEFLSVTGDGTHSIEELLLVDRRALMYIDGLRKMHGDFLKTILASGERVVVSPYGNHARGSMFLDDSHLIDDEFTQMIDELCKRIPGFYFGRMDIRFDNWEDFKKGEKFMIIEVNGAGSEPTHIYDPRHSIFFAWKEILRHWLILYRVSKRNHQLGHPYLTFKQGVQMFRDDKIWSAKLAAMPE